jgi:hypothetical protein
MLRSEQPTVSLERYDIEQEVADCVYGGEVPLNDAARCRMALYVKRNKHRLSPEEFAYQSSHLQRDYWLMPTEDLLDSEQVEVAKSFAELPERARNTLGSTDIHANSLAWDALKKHYRRRSRLHFSIARAAQREERLNKLHRAAVETVFLPDNLVAEGPVPVRPPIPIARTARQRQFPPVVPRLASHPEQYATIPPQGGFFARVAHSVGSMLRRGFRLQAT